MLSYTFPVVSPAAFIIYTAFIFGDVLVMAISNHLVAWVCHLATSSSTRRSSGMLKIGARQLNNWRLHEPTDFLPFCNSGILSTRLLCGLVPRHHFRLPGRYKSVPRRVLLYPLSLCRLCWENSICNVSPIRRHPRVAFLQGTYLYTLLSFGRGRIGADAGCPRRILNQRAMAPWLSS